MTAEPTAGPSPDLLDIFVVSLDAAFRPHKLAFPVPSAEDTHTDHEPAKPSAQKTGQSALSAILAHAQNLLLIRWATQSLVIHHFRQGEHLSRKPPLLGVTLGLTTEPWTDAEWLTIQKVGAIGFGMFFTAMAALAGYYYLLITGKGAESIADGNHANESHAPQPAGGANRAARRQTANAEGKKGTAKQQSESTNSGPTPLPTAVSNPRISYEIMFKVLCVAGFIPW
ncbi:hypothetical protein HDU93_004254, partial [Gonapodya sp. JEL0774]